jgi:uncharacterized membrane protein
MATDRGLDRLTYFTDAIAAIAITLLILPIVDRVADSGSAAEFFEENLPSLGAFALSFLVIARLWIAHHSAFEHVVTYTSPLRWLSLAWAFTIALLPLPTAMVAQWTTTWPVVLFYIGTMTASSLLLTAIYLYIRRHPVVQNDESPVSTERIRTSLLTNAEFLLALIVGTLVPVINYFALLALFLSIPINAVLRRRARA